MEKIQQWRQTHSKLMSVHRIKMSESAWHALCGLVMVLCYTACRCWVYAFPWLWYASKHEKCRTLTLCKCACCVRFLQYISNGIVWFEWRKKNLSVRLILSAYKWVMRNLECLNNFLIKNEAHLKIVRAWHNHQLSLKCLDSLRGFNFVERWIVID